MASSKFTPPKTLVGLSTYQMRMYYLNAAVALEGFARDVHGDVSNLNKLMSALAPAWKGTAATSLEQALRNNYRLASGAEADLWAAAAELRRVASQIPISA